VQALGHEDLRDVVEVSGATLCDGACGLKAAPAKARDPGRRLTRINPKGWSPCESMPVEE